MKNKKINLHRILLAIGLVVIVVAGTVAILWVVAQKRTTKINNASNISTNTIKTSSAIPSKDDIIARFSSATPQQWGLDSAGVKTKLDTTNKSIALTFDACGGSGGSGYDKDLIDYLIAEKIPATLFINSRWVDANADTFRELAKNPLFTIANHGTLHLPCSISGQEAYGVKGTDSVGAVYDEIEQSAQKILSLTGIKPKYFRAGTAYTDEICPQIAEALGEKVVNFTINGDAGATNSAEQVKISLLNARGGEIVIAHMNQPGGLTAEGLKLAIPELKAKGFEFVKLD